MATSDAPLNVPNVTLAVARGAAPSSNLPASFQLSEGNYSQRNVDPVLIYPRPDSETAAWTKHRRHYPGILYRVPIGVAFGSGPLVYEIIDAPDGATIGEFLVVSGDTLVPNEDYGVLKWANPTAGNHSFHVRVSFQDGFTPIDVQWTLEVTTTGTIFIDAVNGSDTTGDGSLANPFQTANAWWKDDLSDTAYSGFQVCYRGGLHNAAVSNIATGVSDGNWSLQGTDKPLVHYPYPGETVRFDMSNTTIVLGLTDGVLAGPSGSDCYFGKFVYEGNRAGDDPRHFSVFADCRSNEVYAAGGAGQRMTWDTPYHKDFLVNTKTTNNAGALFARAAGVGLRRHFMYVHRPTFENCKVLATANITDPTNFNGYYIGSSKNVLADHITCIDTEFGKGPVVQKGGGENWCVRWVDGVQAPKQNFEADPTGSYMPGKGGPWELTYATLLNDQAGIIVSCVETNSSVDTYDPAVMGKCYIDRCTLSRVPKDGPAVRARADWPTIMDRCLLVSDQEPIISGDFVRFAVNANPLDAALKLTGSNRTTYLGSHGAEIKAE